MKKSTLIPLFTVIGFGLITGLVILPYYNEQAEYEEKFYEIYAFEPQYKTLQSETKKFYDDITIEFTWYADGKILEPEYWTNKCVTKCHGTQDEIVWETDYTKPVTVVPHDVDEIQFTMNPMDGWKINHTEFQKLNQNYDYVEDLKSKGIDNKIIYHVNASHTRDFYHNAQGSALPIMMFFVPVYQSDLDKHCKKLFEGYDEEKQRCYWTHNGKTFYASKIESNPQLEIQEWKECNIKGGSWLDYDCWFPAPPEENYCIEMASWIGYGELWYNEDKSEEVCYGDQYLDELKRQQH